MVEEGHANVNLVEHILTVGNQHQGNVAEIHTVQTIRGVETMVVDANLAGIILTVIRR